MTAGWVALGVLWALFSLVALVGVGKQTLELWRNRDYYTREHLNDWWWVKVPALVLFAPLFALYLFWREV